MEKYYTQIVFSVERSRPYTQTYYLYGFQILRTKIFTADIFRNTMDASAKICIFSTILL